MASVNRIDDRFRRLKSLREKALVGFVTAGDPSFEQSLELIAAMCDAGIDILELGVPFSDPTADGPVIQRSSARALKAGITLKKVMAMTRRIRSFTDIPIILFSYYNPILSFRADAFYQDAVESGADGVLVVDLPPEESNELTSCWPGNDLRVIRLVAPTTPPERMDKIASESSGFIYLVSKTGVTGSDGLDSDEIGRHTRSLQALTDVPVCVGFGISTADDVALVARSADGVVIGSAFERLIEENLDQPDLARRIAGRTAEYKAATRLFA